MTVAELIAELQKHDPSMLVYAYDCEFFQVTAPLEERANMHINDGRGEAYPCWPADCHFCRQGIPKQTVLLL